MSAWVVSKGHIDVLVNGLIEARIIQPDEAQATGQLLWKENHHSVNIRYGERTRTPRYEPRCVEGHIHVVAWWHAFRCYSYQCMEWDGFDREPGYRLLRRLEEAIADRYDVTTFPDCDHNVLPLGYEQVHQALVSAVQPVFPDAPSAIPVVGVTA